MRFHKVSALALCAAIAATSAIAADLPSRKAPPYLPPPPPPLWTGFYVGLNAGGIFGGNSSVRTTPYPGAHNTGLDTNQALSVGLGYSNLGSSTGGFIGGGQIGYNWQFSNVFVAGIEADIQGIAGSRTSGATSGAGVPAGVPNETIASANYADKSIDYLGTVRGRLGWLVTPTLLAYATGGLAYGGVNASTSILQRNFPFQPPFASAGSFSDTRAGWTVGGGAEWMFLPNWSAKVEYLYYDLGSVTYAMTPLTFIFEGVLEYSNSPYATTRFDGHIVRAGVNYHFNFGAPTVAAY